MFYEARSQFSIAEVNYIFKEIENLDCKISGISLLIVLKKMRDIYAPHLTNIVSNKLTSQQQFLDGLRLVR